MRELKFRIYYPKPQKCRTCGTKLHPGNFDVVETIGISEEAIEDNQIICQYIERKDKNGIEIYEGDIVKETYEHNSGNRLYEIKYCEAGCDCILAFHPIDKNDKHANYYYGGWESEKNFEIVGNIYENPELME